MVCSLEGHVEQCTEYVVRNDSLIHGDRAAGLNEVTVDLDAAQSWFAAATESKHPEALAAHKTFLRSKLWRAKAPRSDA